jgi:eukaryotic-like serine/threonine-protein kinase
MDNAGGGVHEAAEVRPPTREGGEERGSAEPSARDGRLIDEQRSLQRALGAAYTIEGEIGRGGMATVFRARDRKHGRRVAVKVLHPEIAAAYGAARFLAEIQVTATLQHPHILGFIDSGLVPASADGGGARPYYVMPYVEGQSLRARLQREGQLPVADAVRITCDVASALEYAHQRGVVHRDVKPENILLHGGRAVVADFGIALPMGDERRPRLTHSGVAIGTPEYMSPEQALGERTVDARADVYALGAVTYEMLTGEPPYTGPTLRAITARVMSERPRPIRSQRPTVPTGVEVAVLRALESLPADRFSTVATFGAAVEEGLITTDVSGPSRRWISRREWRLIVGALGMGAAVLGVGLWVGSVASARPLETQAITATLLPPNGVEFTGGMGISLSADGSKLAFVARDAGMPAHLYVRVLASGVTVELPGTEDANAPFWSPDGSRIGFFARDQLKAVDANGATEPRIIAPAPNPRGGAWAKDGTIVFGADTVGVLYRVPAAGGTPEPITRRGGEGPHSRPALHPDGRHFVFHGAGRSGLFLGDLRTAKSIRLTTLGASAVFATRDYLIYDPARLGTPPQTDRLVAQRIDVDAGRLVGPVTGLADNVAAPLFEASYTAANGVLVYQVWGPAPSLTWSDRHGGVLDSLPSADARWFRLSADGSRLAYGGAGGLWVRDLVRGVAVKLPTAGGGVAHPVWSPDGQRIAYTVIGADVASTRITRLDGRGADVEVATAPARSRLEDWSPDGTSLLASGAVSRDASRSALWVTEMKSGVARQWLGGQGNIEAGRFSPDGRWVAYQSDETGAPEVYVRPFPGPGAVVRISTAGGAKPMWRRDGRELYYLTLAGDLTAVSVETAPTFAVSKPRTLIRGASRRPFAPSAGYQVTPTGDRFLLSVRTVAPPLTVRTSWTPGATQQ